MIIFFQISLGNHQFFLQKHINWENIYLARNNIIENNAKIFNATLTSSCTPIILAGKAYVVL